MARTRGVKQSDVQAGRRAKAPDCAVPEYLPASWKTIPFFVLTSSDDFGRRGDLYEYPLNDQVGYVDLGRKARRFKLEGYLIGSDQVAKTKQMRDAAESPQPGVLIHPMYGPQTVACVSLNASADYRKDKKRTKLSFDFIEAITLIQAPFTPRVTPQAVQDFGTNAKRVYEPHGVWAPDAEGIAAVRRVARDLANKIAPGRDEASWDAIDTLAPTVLPPPPTFTVGARTLVTATLTAAVAPDATIPYLNFTDIANPIDTGTATVRRLWTANGTALAKLRLFNGTVVSVEDPDGNSLSVESLIITSRLSLIRDFAIVAVRTKYPTKNAAFDDLDFIMRVYDDEELAAAARCFDDVVVAIRSARAISAQAMLATSIQLPGIFTTNVQGVWPSLVVAHKLYADGSRNETVENYNPHASPFFIGREAVAPLPR